MIPFNKPYYSGNESQFITSVMETHTLTGDLEIIRSCENFLEEKYNFKKAFLVNSCTMALEMAALIADIQPGDEVIIPSYTFVSTANAFALRGAKIVFADSNIFEPNINSSEIRSLITPRTKAIVAVHYAGIACNMDEILSVAREYGLFVIEDAAQCINSFYKGKALGTFGDVSCFSFHETKNIHCGEGGLLVLNNPLLQSKAEIIRNKGTNRSSFLRGEVSKYEWVGLGFSAIPSAITAAFLYGQLKMIDLVQLQRKKIWDSYCTLFEEIRKMNVGLPVITEGATNNAHIFYLVCRSGKERDELISELNKKNIQAVFHYQALHTSPYYSELHDRRILSNADRYSNCLVRLPMYFSLTQNDVELVSDEVKRFYKNRS